MPFMASVDPRFEQRSLWEERRMEAAEPDRMLVSIELMPMQIAKHSMAMPTRKQVLR
jgi:hypothetical protein